jgi:hypothetical protein
MADEEPPEEEDDEEEDPMPEPTGTHNDGGLVFGSQVLTIGGETYVADDINVSFPVKEIVRENEVGVEDADVLIEQPFTGSATLQVLDSTTPVPAVAAAFTITSLNGVTLNCKVKDPGIKWGKDAETKISINFKKRHATS